MTEQLYMCRRGERWSAARISHGVTREEAEELLAKLGPPYEMAHVKRRYRQRCEPPGRCLQTIVELYDSDGELVGIMQE